MPNQAIDELRLPLEKGLRADVTGSERDAILKRIDTYAADIKRRMDSGASPDEFARLSGLHEALAAATRVVDRVWQRAHPRQIA